MQKKEYKEHAGKLRRVSVLSNLKQILIPIPHGYCKVKTFRKIAKLEKFCKVSKTYVLLKKK